ncbi:hypothetical protein CU097_000951, partial [Rhizopus azygosporus]
MTTFYKINNLDLTSSNQLLAIDNSIVKDVRRFVGCLVKANNFSLLVNSFDLICHCQPDQDDFANGLDVEEIATLPVCKLRHKTSTNKSYKEVSIFIELYELLVVGGYILLNDDLTPFLGSSLGNIGVDYDESSQIYIPTSQQPFINTRRLMTQY